MIKFILTALVICFYGHAACAKPLQAEPSKRTVVTASGEKQKVDVGEAISSDLLADLNKGTEKCPSIQTADSTNLLKEQIRLLALSHNPDDIHKLWFRVSLMTRWCDDMTNPKRILDFVPSDKR